MHPGSFYCCFKIVSPGIPPLQCVNYFFLWLFYQFHRLFRLPPLRFARKHLCLLCCPLNGLLFYLKDSYVIGYIFLICTTSGCCWLKHPDVVTRNIRMLWGLKYILSPIYNISDINREVLRFIYSDYIMRHCLILSDSPLPWQVGNRVIF